MLLNSIVIDGLYESKISSAAHAKMHAQQRIFPMSILGCRSSAVVLGSVADVSACCLLLLLMKTSVDSKFLFRYEQEACQVEELLQPYVNIMCN